MPHRGRSARELIGGRWAISLRGFLVICVLIALSTVVSPPVQSWPLTTRLIAVAMQILGAGVVLVVADRTCFRRRRTTPVAVAAVVLLGVAIGLIRVVPLAVSPRLQGAAPPDPATIAQVTLVSILALGALCPTLAFLLAARDWYASERARLIALDLRARSDRLRSAGALDATLDATLAAVELGLRDTRTSTADLMAADQPDTNAIAAGLLEAARSTMRPLSHDLWGAAAQPYPVVRWRQAAASEVRSHPLPAMIPTIGFVVAVVAASLPTLGFPATAAIALCGVVSINACFRVGRAGVRRSRRLALPVAGLAVVAAAVPPMAVAQLAFGVPFGRLALILPLLAGLVVAAGATAALRETGDAVIRDLADLVEETELERIALREADERLRRDIAAYLHGTLQADLVSASVALRNAATSGDADALERASATALAALELRYDPDRPANRPSWPELMASTTRRWSGILDLEWDLPDGDPPSAFTPRLTTVLRESLANAVVHGHATRATIRVRPSGDALEVSIADDGIGPQRGPRGLGSALLDEASAGTWILTPRHGGGADVTALLTL